MFQPKIPTMPQPTGLVVPPTVIQPTAVAPAPVRQPAFTVPATAEPSRPAVQLTPKTGLALVGGGTAVVLVVGVVLVSLLLTVAVTAVSVAVCAVVMRSVLLARR
ncbi:SpdD-like protein [Streptomyces sp. NPDC100445]|uniref:SpdD-like protein n=1 Tax=Streptomyces sp. NPDC100445 TaxID=3366102 RepID=UPI0037F44DF6